MSVSLVKPSPKSNDLDLCLVLTLRLSSSLFGCNNGACCEGNEQWKLHE